MEQPTVDLKWMLQNMSQVPPTSENELFLFGNPEKLECFVSTSQKLSNCTTIHREMSDFIECFCMKALCNYTADDPPPPILCESLCLIVKKYLLAKLLANQVRVRVKKFLSQQIVESNPYYVIFSFLFSKNFPKSIQYYVEFYEDVIINSPTDKFLVVSAGAMYLLMKSDEILSIDEANEDLVDQMVESIVSIEDALRYNMWLLLMCKNCRVYNCPNLACCSFLGSCIFRLLFSAKSYLNAITVFRSWLPLWPKMMLHGKYLRNLPKPRKRITDDTLDGYKAIMQELDYFLEDELVQWPLLSLRGVCKDDYVMALLKCSLSMFPILLKQLRNTLRAAIRDIPLVTSRESIMADIFLTLNNHLTGNLTKGEILLSAFSLKPTAATLELIQKHADNLYDCLGNALVKNEHSPDQWENHISTDWYLEHPEFCKFLLKDFISVIGRTRCDLLTWSVPWKELQFRCQQYLKLGNDRHLVNPDNAALRRFITSAGPTDTFKPPLQPSNSDATSILIDLTEDDD